MTTVDKNGSAALRWVATPRVDAALGYAALFGAVAFAVATAPRDPQGRWVTLLPLLVLLAPFPVLGFRRSSLGAPLVVAMTLLAVQVVIPVFMRDAYESHALQFANSAANGLVWTAIVAHRTARRPRVDGLGKVLLVTASGLAFVRLTNFVGMGWNAPLWIPAGLAVLGAAYVAIRQHLLRRAAANRVPGLRAVVKPEPAVAPPREPGVLSLYEREFWNPPAAQRVELTPTTAVTYRTSPGATRWTMAMPGRFLWVADALVLLIFPLLFTVALSYVELLLTMILVMPLQYVARWVLHVF